MTYRELGHAVGAFGMGLIKLGLKPAPDGADLQHTRGPHTILIFEDTSAPWIIAAFGAFSQSIAVATSYATLGIGAVAEAINETEAKVVVCNIKDVQKLADYCKGKCPSLTTIVYTTVSSTETKAPDLQGPIRAMSFDEVLASGAGKPKFSAPTPEHLAVIMYTSGSTGKPKGVMIKHSCMVASIAGVGNKFKQFGMTEGQERYLAYLPA